MSIITEKQKTIKLELTETELGVLKLHTQVSMSRLLGERMKCSALESILEKLEDAKDRITLTTLQGE